MLCGLTTLVILAFSLLNSVHGRCGSDPGSKEDIAKAEQEFEAFTAAHNSSLTARSPNAQTINVYWNIFYDQNNPSDGNVSDTVISQTLQLANSFYQTQLGLTFSLAKPPSRIPTTNDNLHGPYIGNAYERNVKALRQGGAADLNIYTVGYNFTLALINEGVLSGWSTFPKDYKSNPQNDGIVYVYNYLLGVPDDEHGVPGPDYSGGKYIAHEIGHWLGLYHPFQDGCNGSGDFVKDTPPEDSAASGCPVGRMSCGPSTLDPIHNIMDYSSDDCRTELTPGQYARIKKQIAMYRGINL